MLYGIYYNELSFASKKDKINEDAAWEPTKMAPFLGYLRKKVTILKTMYLILGNGFTIDFLRSIGKSDEINVRNLFKCGINVPWPANNEPGFLSFKYCPNLWNLGARPYMDDGDAIQLIEDIITCANVKAGAKTEDKQAAENTIYIKAYHELTSYLRYLFVYFNGLISDGDIEDKVEEWGWFKFLKKLHESDEYEKVIVVTYNYDIWLERVLNIAGIQYSLGGFEEEKEGVKFVILKPHGSISFASKQYRTKEHFRINYDRDLLGGEASEYDVKYTDLDEYYLQNALIPPAGDSARFQSKWASKIIDQTKEYAVRLNESDEVIMCGISYWHVDRGEIDGILTTLNPGVNVKLVNPNPPKVLNAVLISLFNNYISYTTSKVLG